MRQPHINISLVFVISVVIPYMLWMQQTGPLAIYFTETAPAGQLYYVITKLIGMIALALIACQLISMLASLWFSGDSTWRGLPHRLLGLFIVLFIVVHVVLFFTAVSLRQDALAWSLLVPKFTDYYHTRLAFGLLAVIIFFAVATAGICRNKGVYSKLSRWIHRSYWVGLFCVYLHGLAIGSESQTLWGFIFYGGLGTIIVLLIVFRGFCMLNQVRIA